jgi:hypothetical protein
MFEIRNQHKEPIQEVVESDESVVIPCVAVIREGAAADVETRAPTSRPPQGASLRQ